MSASTYDENKTVDITVYANRKGPQQITLECREDRAATFIAALGKPTHNEELSQGSAWRLLTYETMPVGNLLDDLARFCDMLRGLVDLQGAPVALRYSLVPHDEYHRVELEIYSDNVVCGTVHGDPVYYGRRLGRRLANIRRTGMVRYCKPDASILIAMTEETAASTSSMLTACKKFATILR